MNGHCPVIAAERVAVAQRIYDFAGKALHMLSQDMDAIHEALPGKENKAERERLLSPLRAQCVRAGHIRYCMVSNVLTDRGAQ